MSGLKRDDKGAQALEALNKALRVVKAARKPVTTYIPPWIKALTPEKAREFFRTR